MQKDIEILKVVSNFLRSKRVTYWLTDGTLLGIIRNHGLIENDDDVDLGIQDVDEFIVEELANVLGRYGYVLGDRHEHQNYFQFNDGHNRSIDIGVYKVNGGYISTHHMLPPKEFLKKILFFLLQGFKRETSYASFWYIPKGITRLRKFFNSYLVNFLASIGNTIFCFCPTYKARLLKKIARWYGYSYNLMDVLPTEEIVFDGAVLAVPRNAEAFLEMTYGSSWRVPISKEDYIWYNDETLSSAAIQINFSIYI
jgi:lipopolysaccharide cholinephosphotransferase